VTDRHFPGLLRGLGFGRVPAVLTTVVLTTAVLAVPLAVAPAVAKDTGLIFVSNEKSNNIIVLDPKTQKVVKDLKTSRRPRDMHFSADRSKLYVACGDDDVIDVARFEPIRQLLRDRDRMGIAPDSRQIHRAGHALVQKILPFGALQIQHVQVGDVGDSQHACSPT